MSIEQRASDWKCGIDPTVPGLPDDEDELIWTAGQAMVSYDQGVMASDLVAMVHAARLFKAVILKMNKGTLFACDAGDDSPSERLRRALSALDSAVPRWGQCGAFFIEHAGIKAVVQSRSTPNSLAFSFHAVSGAVPFISETGYRSFITPRAPFATLVDDAARMWIEAILGEIKRPVMIAPNYRTQDFTADYPWLSPDQIGGTSHFVEASGQGAFGF